MPPSVAVLPYPSQPTLAAMVAQVAEAGLVAEAGPVVDGIDAIITGFPRYFL